MKVSDLHPNEIRVGLRIRGAATGRPGTVTRMKYHACDRVWYVHWDDDEKEMQGFCENQSPCEVILDDKGKPVFVEGNYPMNLGQIYEKLHLGDSISDEELVYGIQEFRYMAKQLQELGPHFFLAWQRIWFDLEKMETYQRERARG